jgi:hypothetical protein
MINEDWEFEHSKDIMYALERQKELEEKYKQTAREPTTINIIYNEERNSEQIFRNNKKRV